MNSKLAAASGNRCKTAELDFDPSRDLPSHDVARAKRYSRVRLGLFAANVVVSVVRTAAFAGSGASAKLLARASTLAPNPAAARMLYLGAYTAGSWAARLPLSYVGGHRVERAYGLTKQSAAGWFADEVKHLGVSLALQVPATSIAFAVIRRRPKDWWLVLAGASVPLTVAASQLAPVLLMPLFNKFESLDDEALAERVRLLAAKAGVDIADVYRMDMSRQTEKANAFFTGIGTTKRIVLGDTLLDRFTPDEIEGIVAHELGHQVYGDMWRMVALGNALGFTATYLVARVGPVLLARTSGRTGVSAIESVASLPLIELILAGFSFAAGPVQAAVSQAIERRTDRFAVTLTGDGNAYGAAIGRLAMQNLADPRPPRALVVMLYTHPPIAERIAAARGHRPSPLPNASA